MISASPHVPYRVFDGPTRVIGGKRRQGAETRSATKDRRDDGLSRGNVRTLEDDHRLRVMIPWSTNHGGQRGSSRGPPCGRRLDRSHERLGPMMMGPEREREAVCVCACECACECVCVYVHLSVYMCAGGYGRMCASATNATKKTTNELVIGVMRLRQIVYFPLKKRTMQSVGWSRLQRQSTTARQNQLMEEDRCILVDEHDTAVGSATKRECK